MSQLDLLDARRSELRNRRQVAAGALGAVPGHGRTRARAGWRLGAIMSTPSRDDDGGPLIWMLCVVLVIYLLWITG